MSCSECGSAMRTVCCRENPLRRQETMRLCGEIDGLRAKVADLTRRIRLAAKSNAREPFVTVEEREELARVLDLRRPLSRRAKRTKTP